MSDLSIATSIKQSLIQWILGVGAVVLTWQGVIAFWLGCIVTLLTIYKIFLDIQLRRMALRSQALAQVAKKISVIIPEQKQHGSDERVDAEVNTEGPKKQ